MSLSRRQLLSQGAASSLAFLGGMQFLNAPLQAQGRSYAVNPLRIPELLDGAAESDAKVFGLTAQAGEMEFFEGISTPTIGINGPYLGPTLRFRADDNVRLNVTNKLHTDTTLHWHGLHLPAAADGGPHQVVRPGATWSPEFKVRQKAAMFWYHSHLMCATGAQVNQGLAGLILVEDDESDRLKLPSEYGIDDVPLVIQDRRFTRDGQLVYLTSMHDQMMGFKGDTILVNGTVRPYFKVRRQRTRLRLLNGSNARIYNFGFSDLRSFFQIASDGSLLEKPVSMKAIRLSPGERAEIVVNMVSNSRVTLMSYPDTAPVGRMMGGMMRSMVGNDQTFPILELRADRLETSVTQLPTRLVDVPQWSASHAHRTRNFELNMPMMGMMGGRGSMMGRGHMMGRRGVSGHSGNLMGINGRSMDIDRIDERVPLGAIEIWSVVNDTPLAHPFHIHDVQFRVLDRNGKPAGAHEAGFKDTVLVDPGEIVRVIAEFADYADDKNPYMYHCHILEHEDAGMMGQFVVTA